MNYINTTTKDYPISEYEIRQSFPNISFPDPFVPPDGYAAVNEKDLPSYDATSQVVQEKSPRSYKGVYYQQWEVVDLDSSVAASNREARNAQLIDTYTVAVQKFLDTTAKTKGYDSIASACSYSLSTVEKFKNEGIAAISWRDAVWVFCYDALEKIKSGELAFPESTDAFISTLPTITW